MRSAPAFYLKLTFFFLSVALSAQAVLISETRIGPQVIKYTLDSPSVGKNSISSPRTVALQVLLPVDYEKSSIRYPVIYYLHGFRGNPQEIRQWQTLADQEAKQGRPFILVGVEGKNRFQGSFFVNSPVSGYWEDWLVNEAVSFIDSRLRTIPKPESRGLFGLSMGGFGTLHNALAHPEVFGAAYAVAPGVFEPETGLDEALGSWKGDTQFKQAYGAAFAGNPNGDPSNSTGTPEDLKLYALWQTGFGGWDARIETYLGKKEKLKALAIEWGSRDGYVWIPTGSAWLAEYLPQKGIPVRAIETNQGHDLTQKSMKEYIFPFFNEHLIRE